ncbi:hypothetical protein PLESTB_000788300 [Pleodorina starrii]|uniref:Uncharacterized protein n=1 Tax=Pleodorina starrii TaxID=330485 RepID=A0A9W6BLK2_9CHLO|nr:hypothetical protein PLESTM_000496500 [Pleodorina starrii]GLC53797.1 hypothetical protein PLESTB_000788300 [Pleodorina starrii]GLC72976.1 hypothetical protein PLESTF_001315800 [Pleodorina starrii]
MAAAAIASSMLSDDSERPQTISSSVPSISECSHRGGFTGMFKVPSLVFDIELEDNGIGGHWQEEDWEEDEVVSEIQRFVQPTTAAEARMLSDVKAACPHAKDGQDTERLVSILSALGYRCSLRTALGGGDGPDCLRNLRHTFIVCECPASNPNQPVSPSRRYIVDTQFKEQFIIAKTTARYAAILAAIPQIFVGPEEHLSLLVNFLCSEMSSAFRQLGSVLPPWRQASSMLSKWKPRKSVDASLLGAAAAAATTSGIVGAAGGGAGALRCGGGGLAAFGTTGLGPHPFTAAQQQQQQPQWPGLGSCKQQGPSQQQQQQQQGPSQQQQQHLSQLHQWQQQAAQGLGSGMRPTIAVGAPPPMGGGGGGGGGGGVRRSSYEPQRVVFGGNFIPITPSPALAS